MKNTKNYLILILGLFLTLGAISVWGETLNFIKVLLLSGICLYFNRNFIIKSVKKPKFSFVLIVSVFLIAAIGIVVNYLPYKIDYANKMYYYCIDVNKNFNLENIALKSYEIETKCKNIKKQSYSYLNFYTDCSENDNNNCLSKTYEKITN